MSAVLFFRYKKITVYFSLLFLEGKLNSLSPHSIPPSFPSIPSLPAFIEIDGRSTVVGYVLTLQNSIFHTVMLVEVIVMFNEVKGLKRLAWVYGNSHVTITNDDIFA